MGKSTSHSFPYNTHMVGVILNHSKSIGLEGDGDSMDAINAGDTAWILVATALVMMMTPALAFFYGGMVRKKNLLSTINLSFITIALISLQWVLIGYTLAFGTSIGGLFGGMNFFGLS